MSDRPSSDITLASRGVREFYRDHRGWQMTALLVTVVLAGVGIVFAGWLGFFLGIVIGVGVAALIPRLAPS